MAFGQEPRPTVSAQEVLDSDRIMGPLIDTQFSRLARMVTEVVQTQLAAERENMMNMLRSEARYNLNKWIEQEIQTVVNEMVASKMRVFLQLNVSSVE